MPGCDSGLRVNHAAGRPCCPGRAIRHEFYAPGRQAAMDATPLLTDKGSSPMDNRPSFLSLMNIKNARRALKEEGYLLIENGYSLDLCQSIIQFIDDYKDNDKSETNYAGTELRIWDAHKLDCLLYNFYEECNLFMSCLLGADTEAFTLLAIRNKALDLTDEESTQSRWHLDSLRKQLKIFLFLSDTTELSGPFEFIPKTYTTWFKAQMLCKGSYLRVSDIWSGKRAYAQLDDTVVNELSAKGYNPMPVICQAGAIMVIDTSAIHRARPCHHGTRYALTTYYR